MLGSSSPLPKSRRARNSARSSSLMILSHPCLVDGHCDPIPIDIPAPARWLFASNSERRSDCMRSSSCGVTPIEKLSASSTKLGMGLVLTYRVGVEANHPMAGARMRSAAMPTHCWGSDATAPPPAS